MKTCIVTTETYLNHNTGQGHPERPDRVRTIIDHFKKINPKILSVAQLLSKAIVRIHQHESVSAMFRRENIVTR